MNKKLSFLIIFLISGLSLTYAQNSIMIEAENYTDGSESIVVAANATASNGQVVEEFRGGAFLEYTFNAPEAGTYDLTITASNRAKDESNMDVDVNGVVTAGVPITRTNDWTVFADNVVEGVELVAGENTLRLTQNLSLSSKPDKMEFTLQPEPEPEPLGLAFEAEDYTDGSASIVVAANAAASNGQVVEEFRGGAFLEYTFNAPEAGTYDLTITASNRAKDESNMNVDVNGVVTAGVPITRTNDWTVFADNVVEGVELVAGENTLRLTQNLSLSSKPDKMEFTPATLGSSEFITRDVAVYPNPSSGVFNIESNLNSPNYQVISIQGKVLEEGVLNNKTLNLSSYAKGVYLLQLTSDTHRMVEKIVIK
jgi:hypothetical protein